MVMSVCIVSGLIVFFSMSDNKVNLQSGAYMILLGWIFVFFFQVKQKINSSKLNNQNIAGR